MYRERIGCWCTVFIDRPGIRDRHITRKAAVEGIEIVDDIYQYLISDALYNTSYETKNPFAQ